MKNFFIFLILTLLVVLQTSFLPSINYLDNINLILILIFSFIFILGIKKALWWGLVGGLMLDLYSILNFGVITIALISSLVLTYFLFKNFFINRSFSSLIILITTATLFYNLILIILSKILKFINLNTYDIILTFQYFYSLIEKIIFNILLILIIFFIGNYLSRKLRFNFKSSL